MNKWTLSTCEHCTANTQTHYKFHSLCCTSEISGKHSSITLIRIVEYEMYTSPQHQFNGNRLQRMCDQTHRPNSLFTLTHSIIHMYEWMMRLAPFFVSFFLTVFYCRLCSSKVRLNGESLVIFQKDVGWKSFSIATESNASSHYSNYHHMKTISKHNLQANIMSNEDTRCFDQRNRVLFIWEKYTHEYFDMEQTIACSDSYSIMIVCEKCLAHIIDTMEMYEVTKSLYLYELQGAAYISILPQKVPIKGELL